MGKMSRGQLPATHAFVFDLKSGEVSTLISDASGFYIYHLLKKEFQPFEVVKPQIKAQLSSQRAQDALKKVDDAAKIEVNDAYFGPPGPTAGAFHGPTGAAPKPTPVPQPKPKQ